MIYVCSDIHGRLDRYNKVVSKLTESDELYILGDVIDRGEFGIEILQDIIKRPNVHLILGNHEYMMFSVLLLLSIESNTVEDIVSSDDFKIWVNPRNGGAITYQKLLSLDYEDVVNIFNLLMNSYVFKRINVNGKRFHLSHASAISKFRDLDGLTVRDMIDKNLLDDFYDILQYSPFSVSHNSSISEYDCDNESYVVGHRPVQFFGSSTMICIYNSIYNIDGGCALGDNYPNCLMLLCLDDMSVDHIK